ncbi:MAG: glycosyltransferase [Chitinophagaceae bacterium]|nr:glycosyltransferase [Chitinophagaceae bacterium]MBK8605299.1 glycosyltransferase [Chitinophagaceae bacterium]MBP6477019.1 glycosyltransferase [Chitinophagaceae bacterium]MBP7108827.1 glycosyltransferase [Chitinophagaceae bacterium]HQV54585.1 glycosyltransferase [Chitinophagaceae bacterium]
MTPVLSIIIPCYNLGQYLQEAIESVELHANKNIFEIVIVNDGSTEEYTITILAELEKKGYHIIHQNNEGLSGARNKGIEAAKGKYILPLDADNKINPLYITKGISILENNIKVGIVYGDSKHFGEEKRIFKPGKFSLKKLLIENYIDACIVFRKKIWEQAQGYDTKLSLFEDWDFNLTAAKLGWEFYYIPEIMFEYRIRFNSMQRIGKRLEENKSFVINKHGSLYRNEFLKTITISSRLKSSLYDLWCKIKRKPNY